MCRGGLEEWARWKAARAGVGGAEAKRFVSRVSPKESKARKAADKGGREWSCLKVRGAGVRPDSAISAASEIARRKNKSFAQYTGAERPSAPTGWGWNKKIWTNLPLHHPLKK